MNISIVCPNYPPANFEGGISHYSRLLAMGMKSLGHQVYAISSTEFTKPEIDSESPVNIISVKGPWNHRSVKKIKEIAIKNKIEEAVFIRKPS